MFADGSHIIYVNGNYKGNDAIGQLISDFHQTNPENMHYDALAQGVKHFKEVEGGHEKISEIVEKYGDERAMKAKIVSTQNLMKNMKLTLEARPSTCWRSGRRVGGYNKAVTEIMRSETFSATFNP